MDYVFGMSSRKIDVFSLGLIIVEVSFWVVATKAFGRSEVGSIKSQISSASIQAKQIAIIVTWYCSRKDVRFPESKNRSATPFTIFPVELQLNTKQNALGPRFATSLITKG